MQGDVVLSGPVAERETHHSLCQSRPCLPGCVVEREKELEDCMVKAIIDNPLFKEHVRHT
jgi:hypothetical protein